MPCHPNPSHPNWVNHFKWLTQVRGGPTLHARARLPPLAPARARPLMAPLPLPLALALALLLPMLLLAEVHNSIGTFLVKLYAMLSPVISQAQLAYL